MASNEAMFDEAKALLTAKNNDGNSVYKHLCSVVEQILITKGEKAYQKIEQYSAEIKEKNAKKVEEKPIVIYFPCFIPIFRDFIHLAGFEYENSKFERNSEIQ